MLIMHKYEVGTAVKVKPERVCMRRDKFVRVLKLLILHFAFHPFHVLIGVQDEDPCGKSSLAPAA